MSGCTFYAAGVMTRVWSNASLGHKGAPSEAVGTRRDLGLSSVLLSAAIYPGWSTAAGADVPERHGAVPHGSAAAGAQRNPALVLEEQQIGQADPGLAPHHLPVTLERHRAPTPLGVGARG